MPCLMAGVGPSKPVVPIWGWGLHEVINAGGGLYQVRGIGKGRCNEGYKKGLIWTEAI